MKSVTIEVVGEFRYDYHDDPEQEFDLIDERVEQAVPMDVESISVRESGRDHDLAAITEQDDGTYVIQLMDECDPDDDPHGDGAVLADELTVGEVMGP